MGSQDELDETMCKRPWCPHPQCWMSFRRIEQGCPRYRSLRSIHRSSSECEGRLPVLTVTTLPDPQFSSVNAPCSHSPSGLRRLSFPATNYSLDKKMSPGLNLDKELIMSCGLTQCVSPRNLQKSSVDVSFASCQENRQMSLVWIPSCQQKYQPECRKQENKDKILQVGIKDLTFEITSKPVKKEDLDLEVQKVTKSTKVPTGGFPQNLALTCIQPPVGRQSKSWSFAKEHRETLPKNKRRSSERYQDMDFLEPSPPRVPGLENRRVVLHDTRIKHQLSSSVPRIGPVCRLDDQYLKALKEMEINLESIRNQPYLWKKYIGTASPSGRIKPSDHQPDKVKRPHKHKLVNPGLPGTLALFPCYPDYYKHQEPDSPRGSVGCSGVQSSESDSGEAVSLHNQSQSSWTESYKTSAGIRSITRSKEKTTKEPSEETMYPKPAGGQDNAEEQEANVTGFVASEGEIQPRDPAQSTDCDTDSNGERTATEQGAVSLLPSPPPPSPVHTDSEW